MDFHFGTIILMLALYAYNTIVDQEEEDAALAAAVHLRLFKTVWPVSDNWWRNVVPS